MQAQSPGPGPSQGWLWAAGGYSPWRWWVRDHESCRGAESSQPSQRGRSPHVPRVQVAVTALTRRRPGPPCSSRNCQGQARCLLTSAAPGHGGARRRAGWPGWSCVLPGGPAAPEAALPGAPRELEQGAVRASGGSHRPHPRSPQGVPAGRDLPSPGPMGTVPTSVPPLSSRCFSLWGRTG